jgi:serine/threonine-protein kinase HipA
MNRRALVYFDRVLAGWLDETDRGTSFRYAQTWLDAPQAQAISLTMPLRLKAYEFPSVPPFFLGLLPEGWLLELALGKLKLSSDDPFALLMSLCADCVGAVRVLPDQASITEQAADD